MRKLREGGGQASGRDGWCTQEITPLIYGTAEMPTQEAVGRAPVETDWRSVMSIKSVHDVLYPHRGLDATRSSIHQSRSEQEVKASPACSAPSAQASGDRRQ